MNKSHLFKDIVTWSFLLSLCFKPPGCFPVQVLQLFAWFKALDGCYMAQNRVHCLIYHWRALSLVLSAKVYWTHLGLGKDLCAAFNILGGDSSLWEINISFVFIHSDKWYKYHKYLMFHRWFSLTSPYDDYWLCPAHTNELVYRPDTSPRQFWQ